MSISSVDEAARLVGTDQPVQTRIVARDSGQFRADIGIPAVYRGRAQRRPRWAPHGSPDSIIGTEFECVVIDLDDQRRPILTDSLPADEAAQWNTLLQKVHALDVGERRQGTVAVVLSFGAFIDFDGLRGLLPAAELDHTDPPRPGDTVTIEIVATDPLLGRISLRRAT